MELNIESLNKVGAFTGRPIEKEISWKQGEQDLTATVYIRPMGYHSAISSILTHNAKLDGIAGHIAASICDKEGRAVFTVADITGEADPQRGALDGALTVALMLAIQEVNDLGKITSSAQKTNSGANLSSTGSAGEPSPKQKKRSASKNSSSGQNIAEDTEA